MEIPNLQKVPHTPQRFKMKLNWKLNKKAVQPDSNFKKQFPKYFGKHSFTVSSLFSHPTFEKMRRLKIINRTTIVYHDWEKHVRSFDNLRIQTLFRLYKKTIRSFERGYLSTRGTFYPDSDPPPFLLKNCMALENFHFSAFDYSIAKYILALRQLKFFSITPTSSVKGKLSIRREHLLKRMLFHVSKLKSIQLIEVLFSDRINKYLELAELLNLLHNAQSLSLKVETRNGYADFSSTLTQSEDILGKITYLTLECYLSNCRGSEQRKDDQENIKLTFSVFRKLKNLKLLDLFMRPPYGADEGDLLCILDHFYIPESVEKLRLRFEYVNFGLIFPYPKGDKENSTCLLPKNPILECSYFQHFLSVWEKLYKLNSLVIRIVNGWKIGYFLNKYLAFAIISKIPKLVELKYLCSIYDCGEVCELPPMDLFMLFESLQHHFHSLETLVIDEWDTMLKEDLEKLSIQMPNLKNFILNAFLNGNKALYKLPRLLAKEGNSQLNLEISKMKIKDDNDVLTLFDNLKSIPAFCQIHIDIERDSISNWFLEEQMSSILKSMYSKGSMYFCLALKKISLDYFKGVRRCLSKSSKSCGIRLKEIEGRDNNKILMFKTPLFKDFSGELSSFIYRDDWM